MQWRGRRTSTNVQDRRRGGGGAMRIGGAGAGATIVVLLLSAFLGVDLTPLLQGSGLSGGQVSQQQAPSGPNQIDDDEEAFVATILAETEQVWGELFERSGQRYPEPSLVLYAGGTGSACGSASAAMGPFYCPADQSVYLDTTFFQVMERQMNAGGEFANAYVIAHEVGHHVQNVLGTLQQVNAQRARVSERESNALSVRVELQADCYAGLWARHAAQRLQVTDADIRQALNTAAQIGDDALQQAAGRSVVVESFTHGSSEQRQRWFFRGYQSGDPQQCDSFNTREL